jgi:hypothetical protein
VPAWLNRKEALQISLSHNQLTGQLWPSWSKVNPAFFSVRCGGGLPGWELWGAGVRAGRLASRPGARGERAWAAAHRTQRRLEMLWAHRRPRHRCTRACRRRGNKLTGSLPAAFGKRWTATKELDIARNNFKGALPRAWGNMTSLVRLDLSRNALSGGVPGEWAALLPRVRAISLKRNRLRGLLPAAWGPATAGSKTFYIFDARRNRGLAGCVPAGMERFLHKEEPFASIWFDGTGIGTACSRKR